MRKNSGITLIALIITIIVMLILVAVSVTILINSGLIGKAKEAKTDTQSAYAQEQKLGDSINMGGTVYNSIDDIISSSESVEFTIQFEKDGNVINTFTCHAKQGEKWGEWITRKYDAGDLDEIINYVSDTNVRNTLRDFFTETQYDGGRIYIGDSTDGDTCIYKQTPSFQYIKYDDVIETNMNYVLCMGNYWF